MPYTKLDLKGLVAPSAWDDSFLQKTFTGRQWELDSLRRELLLGDTKVVAITGLPGMGKTALAMMFAEQHRESFPGGIFHLYGTPWETFSETILHFVGNPTVPYLLILDDVEKLPSNQLYSELLAVRTTRPLARIICIGRSFNWSGQSYFTLALGSLSQMEMSELIAKRIGASSVGSIAHDLFAAGGGNPLFAVLSADLIKSSGLTPRDLLRRLGCFSYPGLIGIDGTPLSVGTEIEKQIVFDIRSVNDDLLKKAHANPELLYELSSRRFEEFVGEVLDRLGYEITLTPASKDGGKDIYAARKDHLGSFLYVVECKKYSPDNPVGVGLIRELNGVVQAERATAGILATTSFFTKGAKEFQARLSNQISLKDYVGIQQWLDSIFRADHH